MRRRYPAVHRIHKCINPSGLNKHYTSIFELRVVYEKSTEILNIEHIDCADQLLAQG
jgi:hypothetical protein